MNPHLAGEVDRMMNLNTLHHRESAFELEDILTFDDY